MRLGVFTGSSPGSTPRFAAAAAAFGRELAAAGVGVVYGGGRVGLMGAVAEAAAAAGGEVIGVMPRFLVDREIAYPRLAQLEVVDTLHGRKARMAELADAFVALPGGAGTLDEWFEAWTWGQLGLHTKPVALLDVDGFWQPLLALLDHLVAAGFLSRTRREALLVASDAAGLLAQLPEWSAPPASWDGPPGPGGG